MCAENPAKCHPFVNNRSIRDPEDLAWSCQPSGNGEGREMKVNVFKEAGILGVFALEKTFESGRRTGGWNWSEKWRSTAEKMRTV